MDNTNRFIILIILPALLSTLAIASSATAQQSSNETIEAEPEPERPFSYVSRNQTLDQLELRVDLAPPDRALLDFGQGLRFGLHPGIHEGGAETTSVMVGAGFGITERLEAGVAVPIRITPTAGVPGLVPYARYRLTDEGSVQLSAQVDASVPFENQAFVLGLSAPLNFYFGDDVARLATGARVEIDFDRSDRLDLLVPAAMSFNVVESVFLGVRSGVRIIDVAQSGGPDWEVPVGGFGGYTFDLDSGPIDLAADFVYFVSPNPYRQRFEIRVGATFYFDLEGEPETES